RKASRFRLQLIDQARMSFPGTARACCSSVRPNIGRRISASNGEVVRFMKLTTAIIRPHKREDVRQAVGDVGVQGVTVTEVRGFGRQRGHTEVYRGAEYVVEFVPKTKIEIAVDDALAERVIEAITNTARTDRKSVV